MPRYYTDFADSFSRGLGLARQSKLDAAAREKAEYDRFRQEGLDINAEDKQMFEQDKALDFGTEDEFRARLAGKDRRESAESAAKVGYYNRMPAERAAGGAAEPAVGARLKAAGDMIGELNTKEANRPKWYKPWFMEGEEFTPDDEAQRKGLRGIRDSLLYSGRGQAAPAAAPITPEAIAAERARRKKKTQ